MRWTVLCVRSRVLPPAPYVTETNFGASGSSRFTARQSDSSISAVFGGKNSKETLKGTARLRGIYIEGGRQKAGDKRQTTDGGRRTAGRRDGRNEKRPRRRGGPG